MNMTIVGLVFGIVIILIIIIMVLLVSSVRIIQPYQEGLLIIFGKFKRKLIPGINFVPPLISKVVTIDLRTQSILIPRQEIITKDGKSFDKDVIINFKIVDPKKVYFKMPDYKNKIIDLSQKKLRDKISRFNYDEII